MSFSVDPRPKREGPAEPTQDEAELVLAVVVPLLDAMPGMAIPRAQVLAKRALSQVTYDPSNGEPIWSLESGAQVRGNAGAVGVAQELARRERKAAHGPDPVQVAVEQLEARGVPAAEARRRLGTRLQREEDGSITLARRGRLDSGALPPFRGGDELIRQAVTYIAEEHTQDVRTQPSDAALAAHRAAAARRGTHYRI